MANRYSAIIQYIFEQNYNQGDREVAFSREEIVAAATALNIQLPKNLGDVVYSFKYRADLPTAIQEVSPDGLEWVIRGKGPAKYAFVLRKFIHIVPDEMLATIKIPDATPEIVVRYSMDDEQALLTSLRYNRLVDIFTGVTCYSLQNHLRTTVPDYGQVETDEIYVGVNQAGVHFVFPVQAKGGNDTLGITQIEQDIALCAHKFPHLVCRPVAAQFMGEGKIALFELGLQDEAVVKVRERHYRLVPSQDLSNDELARYRDQST